MLVGAGDIANCDLLSGGGAQATARVLDRIQGTVFTVGDHAYGPAPQSSIEIATSRHGADTRPGLGHRPAITTTPPARHRDSTTSARTPGRIAAAITATTLEPGTSCR